MSLRKTQTPNPSHPAHLGLRAGPAPVAGNAGKSRHQLASRFGGLYIRPHYFAKAGDQHKGHRHFIDHVTVLTRGGVLIEYGEKDWEVFPDQVVQSREYRVYDDPSKGPMIQFIEIDMNVYHRLTALEDNTMYSCVFSLGGDMTHAEIASAQAGLCDDCVDGSGCQVGAFR